MRPRGGAARAGLRLPLGHPEGLIEALANLYGDFVAGVRARRSGAAALGFESQTIRAGVRGMGFIEAALESQAQGHGWVKLDV